MERLDPFWKLFNIIFPFADFMYILQQEEYSSARLLRWLPRFFFRRNIQKRERLKVTKRVKLTLIFAVGFWLVTLILALSAFPQAITRLIAVLVWLVTIPVFVLLVNISLTPLFEQLKRKTRARAKAKVAAMPSLKVVIVAGSFGKTTVKNFVHQLVQYTYRTQMIPGNINTTLGIAEWIINNLQPSTELLIAEVDAYYIGEIANSSEILPADIAVLTNIADQHLERFGNEENLAIALGEVFQGAKSSAKLITTAETVDKIINFEQEEKELIILDTPTELTYADKALQVKGLSSSNKINLNFALKVAALLNIPANFIEDGVNKLELPDRRQRLTEMFGYQAIDDSYNISFTTAQAGLEAARIEADKQGKKLLVIAAGIPELGPKQLDNNKKLGSLLAGNADHIIILGSKFADEIAAGIGNNNKYTRISDLTEFLAHTKNEFNPDEWFLLMEPELGDLYY